MDIKPDLIIEIGTLNGGGALYYADLLYLLGKGQVHTINLENEVYDQKVFNHGQIKFFYGGFDAYDIEENTKGFEKILVIDDAAHTYEDVLKALNKFNKVVSKESYFIVEDGVVSFTGVADNYGGGPRKAIDEFLQTNDNFIVDRSLCDFFGTNATFNPDGYLKRIK
jgi:cephalosporin hydroxylase